MRSLAEPWRPWRAVAARLLWHYRTHGGPAAATDAPAAQPDILP
jgi:3-methyladenine DNA glycosylase/8-oxoguanine DNA glycosylase